MLVKLQVFLFGAYVSIANFVAGGGNNMLSVSMAPGVDISS